MHANATLFNGIGCPEPDLNQFLLQGINEDG
jgi:hypothetical protein